jgi:type III secretory pathway component EscT
MNEAQRFLLAMHVADRTLVRLLRAVFAIGCAAMLLGAVLGLVVSNRLWGVAMLGLLLSVLSAWVEQDIMFETEQQLRDGDGDHETY